MKRYFLVIFAALLALPWIPGTASAQSGAITVTIDCRSLPQTVWLTNNASGPVRIEAIGSIQDQALGIAPFYPNDSLLRGTSAGYGFGDEGGAHRPEHFLSQQPIFSPGIFHPESDGVVVQTSIGTGQVTCAQGTGTIGAPLLGGSRVNIQVDCLSQPQTLTVTNYTSGPVTVQRVTSQSYAARALAPFTPNDSLRPGTSALYAFGNEGGAHRPERFLSQRPIFSDAPDAQNEDGVLVMTSVGNATVSCAAGQGSIYTTGTPTIETATPGIPNVFSVDIDCFSTPQTVRIANGSNGTLTVTGINGILRGQAGRFPFEPSTAIPPGGFVIYAFGQNRGASAGYQFLASSPIFAQSQPQMSEDGVFVETNAGEAHAFCTVG